MAILMYDVENVEFKFFRLRRHFKNTELDPCPSGCVSTESLVQPTFLPIEIELNRSVIRVPIHFYSAPPGIEILTFFLFPI